MKSEDKIRHNVRAHNRIARKYEKIHDEIFNDIEQARIHNALAQAIEFVREQPKIFAGAGCRVRFGQSDATPD